MAAKISRRDEILQALVHLLQAGPGEKLTTARLAKEVGVSEAALYRHFPSKARMFEGLLEFTEDTLFSRITDIRNSNDSVIQRCGDVLNLLLVFAERNPGLCRILAGDALAGEDPRLAERVARLFDRLETELRQLLKDGELKEGIRCHITANASANLMVSSAVGRISGFQRSGYRQLPTSDWADQWRVLSGALFYAPSI